MPINSKISAVQLSSTINIHRLRFNQLIDSVGNVSDLSANLVGGANNVVDGILEVDNRLDSINNTQLITPRIWATDSSATNIFEGTIRADTNITTPYIWATDSSATNIFEGTIRADTNITLKGSSLLLSNDTSTNSSFYPVFTSSTSNGWSPIVSNTKLTFNPSTGQITAVDFNATSDIMAKTHIETIESPMSILDKINPVSFNWKDTGAKAYGVIAQEVEKVLPSIVKESPNGKAVAYNNLIAFLVAAVKEQDTELRNIKDKLKKLGV